MQKRFDTHFFVVRAPERQIAACDGYETVDAEWLSPSKALKLGGSGERTTIFPTRLNFQLLAEAASADDVVARANAREIVPVIPQVIQREDRKSVVSGKGVPVRVVLGGLRRIQQHHPPAYIKHSP